MASTPTVEQLHAAEELAKRRFEDNMSLKEELKSLRDRLAQKSHEFDQTLTELENCKSSQLLNIIEVDRLKREVNLLTSQKQASVAEFESELSQLYASKQTLFTRVSELESKLDLSLQENLRLDTTVLRFQEEVKHLNDVTTQAQHEITRLRVEKMEQERSWELESQASNKLMDLLKVSEEEAQRELNRVKAQLEETKQELQAAVARIPSVLPTAVQVDPSVLRDMNVTQVYSQYVVEKEKNMVLERENAKLQQHCQHIVHEVELVAPQLMDAKQRYLHVTELLQVANEKLDEAEKEKLDYQREMDNLEHVMEEKEALEQSVQDLQAQIVALLKPTSTAAATPQKRTTTTTTLDFDKDDVQAMISSDLVPIHNISELVAQNTKLLRLIRKLQDEEEGTVELKKVTEELYRMQEARKRQEVLVEQLVQQRDRYRELLHAQDGLKTTQVTNFDAEAMKQEFSIAMEQAKQDLERIQGELRECRAQQVKALSEAEFAQKRVQLSEQRLERESQDCVRWQNANKEQSATLLETTKLVDAIRLDLDKESSRCRKLEQDVSEWKTRHDLQVSEIARLQGSNSSLSEQKSAFQRLQQSLEENIRMWQSRFQDLQMAKKDVDEALKSKSLAEEQATLKRQEMEKQLEQLKQEVQEAEVRFQQKQGEWMELSRQFQSKEEEVFALQQAKQDLETKLVKAVETQYNRATLGADGSLLHQLEEDLRLAVEQREGFKKIASEHEDTLKEMSRVNAEQGKALAGLRTRVAEMEGTIANVETSHAEKKAELEAAHTQIQTLEAAYAQSQLEVQLLQAQATDASALAQRADQALHTAKENYAKLLQIHTSLLNQNPNEEWEVRISEARTLLERKSKELDLAKEEFAKQLLACKKEMQDLEVENRLLLERLPTLSTSSSTTTEEEVRQMLQTCTNQRDRLQHEKSKLELEVSRLSVQVQHLTRSRESLVSAATTTSSTSTSSSSSTDRLELVILKGLNEKLRIKEETLSTELEACKREKMSLEAESLQAIQENAQYKVQVQTLQEDVARSGHQIKLLNERLQGMRDRVGNAQALEEMKLELESQIGVLQSQLEAANQALQEKQLRVSELERQADEFATKEKDFVQQLVHAKDTAAELEKSQKLATALRKKWADESQGKKEATESWNACKTSLSQQEAEVDRLKQELTRLKATLAKRGTSLFVPPSSAAVVPVVMEDTVAVTPPVVVDETAVVAPAATAAASAVVEEERKKKEEDLTRREEARKRIALKKQRDEEKKKEEELEKLATTKQQQQQLEEASSSPSTMEEVVVAATQEKEGEETPKEEDNAAILDQLVERATPSLKVGRRFLQLLGQNLVHATLEELRVKMKEFVSNADGLARVKKTLESKEFLATLLAAKQAAATPFVFLGKATSSSSTTTNESEGKKEGMKQLLQEKKMRLELLKTKQPATSSSTTTAAVSSASLDNTGGSQALASRAQRFRLETKRVKVDGDGEADSLPPPVFAETAPVQDSMPPPVFTETAPVQDSMPPPFAVPETAPTQDSMPPGVAETKHPVQDSL